MDRRKSIDWGRVASLIGAGATINEVAAEVGCNRSSVSVWCRRNGIRAHKKPRAARQKSDERVLKMETMYRQGLTLQVIGDQFGITRERVRQILKRAGVDATEGGIHALPRAEARASKESARIARIEASCIAKWGIGVAERTAARRSGLLRAFENQRKSAASRGIGWFLNYAQWLAIWVASGKLAQRGRGHDGYCMSRIKDDGPYRIGNVHIQTCVQNSREGFAKARRGKKKPFVGVFCLLPGTSLPWFARYGKLAIGRFETAELAAQARAKFIEEKGLTLRGRGWTYLPDRSRTNPFQVTFKGEYVGVYPTEAAAVAAREKFQRSLAAA